MSPSLVGRNEAHNTTHTVQTLTALQLSPSHLSSCYPLRLCPTRHAAAADGPEPLVL